MPSDIRDAAIAWLDAHQKVCPNAAGCKEPANFIGYLCHCLGVQSLADVTAQFAYYELHCEGGEACHGRRAGA